mmetsp:Transcript_44328/g.84762  ORF Transcript_44328/g.84762 Transcript_44328/m.84762 type:complete len:277 (+) Transcript_44328:892-1722(+)
MHIAPLQAVQRVRGPRPGLAPGRARALPLPGGGVAKHHRVRRLPHVPAPMDLGPHVGPGSVQTQGSESQQRVPAAAHRSEHRSARLATRHGEVPGPAGARSQDEPRAGGRGASAAQRGDGEAATPARGGAGGSGQQARGRAARALAQLPARARRGDGRHPALRARGGGGSPARASAGRVVRADGDGSGAGGSSGGSQKTQRSQGATRLLRRIVTCIAVPAVPSHHINPQIPCCRRDCKCGHAERGMGDVSRVAAGQPGGFEHARARVGQRKLSRPR